MGAETIFVTFNFEQRPYILNCKINESIGTAIKRYSIQNDIDVNTVFFLVGGENITNSEYNNPLSHYAKNENNLTILVNKINISFDNDPNSRNDLPAASQVETDGRVNKSGSKNTQTSENCFEKYKVIILISIFVAIFLIIFLPILFKVILKNKKDNNNDDDIIECLSYSNITEECLVCNEDFALYNGSCIPYAFYATYYVDYFYENIKIFNEENINNLYKIKMENEIIEPISQHYFNNIKENKVYFYFYKNCSISLMNMFKDIKKLIYFSFNNRYINDFQIINMRKMFSGCTSLTTISFGQFQGQEVFDITNLFYNCTTLQTVSFDKFEGKEIFDISNLFYNCISLTSISFSNFKSGLIKNMNKLFYNCFSLKNIDISNLNTS